MIKHKSVYLAKIFGTNFLMEYCLTLFANNCVKPKCHTKYTVGNYSVIITFPKFCLCNIWRGFQAHIEAS